MENRDILILMSSYNGENFIREQIDSILKQSVIDRIALHVRDDGSSDSTVEILKEYHEKYPFITYEAGENVGVNESFFRLLNIKEKYTYYAIADQDDIWLENKVETAVKTLEKEDQSMPLLYGSCSMMVDNEMNHLGTTQIKRKEITLSNAIIQNFVPGHTQVFNEKLKEYLMYPIDTTQVHVYDMWITLTAQCFGKIIFDNNYYTLYRQHTKNAFGYGKGIVGWVKERQKRLKKNIAKNFGRQDLCFLETYKNELSEEEKAMFEQFVSCQNSFMNRWKYLKEYKLYRQKGIETIMLYALFLKGGYRI